MGTGEWVDSFVPILLSNLASFGLELRKQDRLAKHCGRVVLELVLAHSAFGQLQR
jgi:hypothetical protein